MKLNKHSEKENNIKQTTHTDNIKQREKVWFKENKEAIDKQNERIKKYGCFSDEHRRF
jgi:post-segregation antitoxin (ccd killing protein)